jgi:hypothetical protein
MEASKTSNSAGGAAQGGSIAPSDAGLLEDARLLWQEIRGLAQDQLTLVALETRLAGKSLVTMIAAGVMIAVLLVTAWLGLACAVVLWLVAIGVAASVAVLLAATANLVLALALYMVARRQSRYLQFPATLRSLRPLLSKVQAVGEL